MKPFNTEAEAIKYLFETRKKSLVIICELLPYVNRMSDPKAKKAFRKAYSHISKMAKDIRSWK
jgi:hypothetical protein